MLYVYEVSLRHKNFPGDVHDPWVIARTISEAQRKVAVYVKAHCAAPSMMEIVAVERKGEVAVP